MLSVHLAKRLRAAGLPWAPARGDRFVVPDRGMDDEVFVLSDMTVELHDMPYGRVVGFNGTVEWSLDCVRIGEVLWLPSEGQLRDRLGEHFDRLERSVDGFIVVVGEQRFSHADAECAYAEAVLTLL